MRERLLVLMPLVLVGALILVVVSQCLGPVGDPDLWWHLRLGTQLLDQQSLSTPHGWSRFATVPWVPTEPLPEVAGAQMYRWFGLGGVAWLHALGLSLLVLAVYLADRRLAAPVLAATATVLTLVGAGLSLTPRPQLLSFALIPVVLLAWMASERDLRPRWWLVPLTWLWSLLHGYWFVGVAYGCLMVAAILWQSRPPRRSAARLVAVPLLSAASVCLNPVGLGVFGAPFAVNASAQFVSEWRRTDLLGVDALACGLMVVLTLVAWGRTGWSMRPSRVLLLLSALFWVWYASRSVAVGAVVLSPVLAEALAMLASGHPSPAPTAPPRRETTALGTWAAVCLAGLAVALARTTTQPFGVPIALDPALSRYPAGTAVIDTYGIGGWVRWRHPDVDPVIDGLATPYAASWFRQVHDAMQGEPGWAAFVAGTGARVALLQDGTPLVRDLRSHGWHVAGHAEGYWLLSAPGGR